MLGLELKEPRAFQDIREETTAAVTAAVTAEVTTAVTAELTKEGIEAILLVRFGEIDEELETVVPKLMELERREYTRLLLNLSRSELIALP